MNEVSALLRSPLLGRLWIVAIAVTALLLWQQLAGWPAHAKWQVEQSGTDPVQVFRFPKKLAPERWHRGLVRVIRDGRSLPRFPSEETFQAATIEGFLIRGNNLHVRLPAGAKGKPVAWTVRLPRTLDASRMWTILGGALLVSALLGGLRNPVIVRACAWWGSTGVPWPALTLAAVVFAAAVLVRVFGFSYPGWENDSPSYFRSVFHVVEGGLPFATPDRPFAYPLLVGTLLRFIPDLRAIVTLHMLGSLVAATCVGAIVWIAGGRLFDHPLLRSLSRILGIFIFAALALNEAILEREWALLSEAWAAFYMGVQVCLAWLLTSRLRPLAPSLAIFAAFCLAGLLTFFTRSNWGFALAFLPVPWVAVCFLNAQSRRAFWIWAASGAAVLIALAAATFGFQGYCKPDIARPYLYDRARALVCWHVPLVQAELDRRLRGEAGDPQRAVLVELAEVLANEIEEAKTRGSGSYPSLTFDADNLYFFTLARGPQMQALSMEERTRLCMELFKDGLRHRPELYLGKVVSQMRLLFISPYQKPNIFMPDILKGVARSEKAIANREMPPRFLAGYAPVVAEARSELARPWPSPPRLAMSERAVLVFGWLTKSFVTCLAVPAAICLACVAWPRWRRALDWRRLAPALTLAAWSFGSAFLSALSTAATQGLDLQRYLQLSIPVTLLAHALWPMLGLAMLLALRRRTPGAADPCR